MHAFVREGGKWVGGGCQSENLIHLCMNSNHSAGGGGGGGGRRRKELGCVMRGDRSDLSEGPVESVWVWGGGQVASSGFIEARSVRFNNPGYGCSVALRSPS